MEKPEIQHGHSYFVMVMIATSKGKPIPVGSVEVKSDSILLEPWMLEDIVDRASKRMTWYAANNDKGKVVN